MNIYYSQKLENDSKLVIRDMQYSDIEGWLILLNQSSEYETTRFTLPEAESYFKSRLGNPDCIDLIAAANEVVIGYRGLRMLANESQHVARTAGIYVLPVYRGRGIATKLVGISESIAKSKGIMIIHGYTLSINKPILRCFEKLGYKVCGTLCKAVKTDSEFVDLVLLYKQL